MASTSGGEMTSPVIEAPRGNIIITPGGKAELVWNVRFQSKYQQKFTRAQMWLDNAVVADCQPFVPFRTGMLVKSGILGTVPGTGVVSYIAPYARFQYYGKLMVGVKSRSAWAKPGEPKVVTNKALTYHSDSLRGSFWFERAKAIHKGEWLRGVQTRAAK